MQFSSKNLLYIYKLLYDKYGPQNWWPASSEFEVILGTILTQNTSWNNVQKAINNLKPYMKPITIHNMQQNKLAELIKPSGYYNIKAKRIKNFLKWYSKFDFCISALKQQDTQYLRKELLNINGIGKETADSIILYALNKPIFVIDAYTRRLFSRLGFNVPEKYDEFQFKFHYYLQKDSTLYNEYHALIVCHCKQTCSKIKKCNNCVLSNICNVGSI